MEGAGGAGKEHAERGTNRLDWEGAGGETEGAGGEGKEQSEEGNEQVERGRNIWRREGAG